MNRREAIKAGIVCAIAPIIPIEATKRVWVEKHAAMGFTELSMMKDLKACKWANAGSHAEWGRMVYWDENTQKPAFKPMTNEEAYKKA